MIEHLLMPKIFWFTGQAGAGKTELANMLKTRLNREQTIIQQNYVTQQTWSSHLPNKKFVIIDGDDMCIVGIKIEKFIQLKDYITFYLNNSDNICTINFYSISISSK